ncbi:c-type cytochrome [Rhodoferax sp. AJA081-3]|uniref:c-type cytochrome n=1 Tax=Rhodoferax sp. AJA081-3 TaxID=2752316 RepID=UPI001ADF8AE4|nr:cytochrome c [Rhodoferax sp. AJA081-3]QTN26696.1 c-type cytochrome [Rhodoferax sp. AJA081-3]
MQPTASAPTRLQPPRRWPRRLLVLLVFLLATTALVAWLNVRGEADILASTSVPFTATPQHIAQGAYLARAGNCAGCHTARGGADYAGGLGIATPFGTVYASNLTPDAQTGLGRWTPAAFWRAMHHGRSMDGRLLYPVFPYTSYTQVSRADSDALFAYLRSLPAVAQANRPHELAFPYNSQAALAVWRALFFRAGEFAPEPTQTEEWNRGAYLVRGLGHCAACHAGRNLLGASRSELALQGGAIPMQHWYAPSLASSREAGVADWATQDVVALLQTGTSPRGSTMGPMAEVVLRSTQYLNNADLQAMAVYLKALPQQSHAAALAKAPESAQLSTGATLYKDHCAQCHGNEGQGAKGAYPALAGNRVVTLETPANLVQTVLHGGFAPATAGNPRPFGMPPFQQTLDGPQIAAVLTYIRHAWGNAASPVSPLEVMQNQ